MKPATVAVGGKVLAQLRLGSTLSAGRVPILWGDIRGKPVWGTHGDILWIRVSNMLWRNGGEAPPAPF